jgi:hypothetical protein
VRWRTLRNGDWLFEFPSTSGTGIDINALLALDEVDVGREEFKYLEEPKVI